MFARSLSVVSFCSAASLVALGVTAESAQSQSSYQYLFVNPNIGNDANAGSNGAPLKTLTRALQVVQPGSIIVLAPGTYSTQTGEVFPLQMKPNTTIKGEPRDRGQNVVIRGGGFYLSRTFARQNVTILGANQAGLTGVTVSNPNPQGYGLWVESTSPVVSDNTFTDSTHDGASVVGNSAPVLRNNYFYQNGANGITIYGSSRPQIQENIFENTGFGINIAQNAAPQIVGNRITQNKDGIVVQGNAQPTLRNNVIDANSRDGLVAIAQSQPNLGTTADPGGNTFMSNGQFDVNAQRSIRSIPASGNQIAAAKSTGQLDFSGRMAPPVASAIPQPAPVGMAVPRPVTFGQALPNRNLPQLRPTNLPPRIAVNSTVGLRRPLPAPRQLNAQPQGIPIQVPMPEMSRSTPRPIFNTASRVPVAPIPIPVPMPDASGLPSRAAAPVVQPPADFGNRSLPVQTARRSSGSVLRVPNGNIPVGRTAGTSVRIWNGASRPSPDSPPSLPNRLAMGLRFRVVVSASTGDQQAQLRSVVPGAFAVRSSVMQAGAFSDRTEADKLLQLLLQQGLNAQIEQL